MTEIDLSGLEHLGFDDPRGWLTFRGLPDELQRQEDQTANADYERRHWRPSVHRVRPATDAERVLLQHLGFQLPAALQTTVYYPSGGVRRREWPQLAGQLEGLR